MPPLRFLVIDDATFIRDLLKKNLRDRIVGAEIQDAASARKAQTLMKTNTFDLILCDWEMPEMTGEEFLRWVRNESAQPDVPFIMVTSRGERDYIVRAVQAGVSDYLGKPFKPETLLNKVSKALAKVGKAVNAPSRRQPGGVSDAGLEALTGGQAERIQRSDPRADLNDSASLLTAGKAEPAAQPRKSKPKAVAKGQAQLNFPQFACQCVIKEISLQLVSCLIRREEQLPAILDPVVVSIVQNDGEEVARLNAFVQSIAAGDNRIDTAMLKLILRFVDDDPDKLDHLSRYISGL